MATTQSSPNGADPRCIVTEEIVQGLEPKYGKFLRRYSLKKYWHSERRHVPDAEDVVQMAFLLFIFYHHDRQLPLFPMYATKKDPVLSQLFTWLRWSFIDNISRKKQAQTMPKNSEGQEDYSSVVYIHPHLSQTRNGVETIEQIDWQEDALLKINVLDKIKPEYRALAEIVLCLQFKNLKEMSRGLNIDYQELYKWYLAIRLHGLRPYKKNRKNGKRKKRNGELGSSSTENEQTPDSPEAA